MSIKLQLPKLTDLKPRINVIGVGGAGCNAINNMISAGLVGVEFVVANTDAQALALSTAEHRLQLGVNLTEGLGAGSKPEIGEAAAEEAIEEIRAQIAGSHMVFIAAGMGGGTGTGAAAVIARTAKELGILVVGIVTKPFHFEGARRMRIAEAGIAEIRKHVDTLIVIPNQNLFRVANEKTTFAEAFVLADQVLYSGVACIVDLIIKEGLINLDFADVRTVMSGMGSAVMGTGEASGDGRASIAAEEAIANPLLDDVSLKGAKGLLAVDHRRPRSHALRGRRGGEPRAPGGRSGSQHHRRRDVRRDAWRPRARVDRRLGHGAPGRAAAGADAAARRSAPAHDAAARSSAASAAAATPRSGARLPASAGARAPRRGHATPPERSDRRQRRRAGTRAARAAVARDVARARQRRHRGRLLADELGAAAGAARQPRRSTTATTPEQFIPAPPADLRRGGRRMPDVEDFPPVAQREYRAKAGYPAQGGPPPPGSEEPPRRGILQRIMGRARRDEMDDPPTSNAAPDPRRMSNSSSDDWWAAERDSQARDDGDEQAPLPEFFNRQRK